jgi:hypothetical protein
MCSGSKAAKSITDAPEKRSFSARRWGKARKKISQIKIPSKEEFVGSKFQRP